jgi:hypothetical protein
MDEIAEAELIGAGRSGGVVEGAIDGVKRSVQAVVLRRCCHELKGEIDPRGRWVATNDLAGPAGMLTSASGALLRGRVRRGVVVCAGELGADLVGLGELKVLEDAQRLLPGLPSLAQLAGGVAVVAEVGKGIRFIDAVAGFPENAERAPVAGGGFGKVTQMVLGVPQAVPGCSLDPAIADFHAQVERLAAEQAGLPVVAK